MTVFFVLVHSIVGIVIVLFNPLFMFNVLYCFCCLLLLLSIVLLFIVIFVLTLAVQAHGHTFAVLKILGDENEYIYAKRGAFQ